MLIAVIGLLLSSVFLPLLSFTQSAAANHYEIGDTGPAGGIIFYIDGDIHYEAAPASWNGGSDPAAQWGCYGQEVPGADGTAIGTGEQNTVDIVAFHDDPANFGGNDYYSFGGSYSTIGCYSGNDGTVAAKVAQDLSLNGYDDWFLPSRDELNAMYTNLHAQGFGGFTSTTTYWSSSEDSFGAAWLYSFETNTEFYYDKDYSYAIRPIRSFDASIVSSTANTTVTATLASTISISTSGSISIPVTPTACDSQSHRADTISVSTNNDTGYSLTLANQDTTTSLSDGSNTILADDGTPASPNFLGGSWGFRVDNVAGFGAGPTTEGTDINCGDTYTWAGVPASTSPFQIKSTSAPATNDTTTVWYGVEVGTLTPSGTYTDTVTYTAVTN